MVENFFKKAFWLIFVLNCFLFFLFAPFSFAQEGRGLEIEYPEISGLKPETVETGLPEYVKYVFNFAIFGIGFILFGALVYAGILYLTSTGQPAKLQEAKERLSSAFLGVIILVSSYLILTTINPQLVKFEISPLEKLTPPEVPSPKPLEKSETSLIALELPYGQVIENGVWNEDWKKETQELLKEDTEVLEEKMKVGDQSFYKISDLNKYLLTLTRDCKCEKGEDLDAVCTAASSFCLPIGCIGDPCKKEVRKKINKILKFNESRMKKLSEYQRKLKEKKDELESQLNLLEEIESEMTSCQKDIGAFMTFNDFATILADFVERGWSLRLIRLKGAPPPTSNPLTFFCLKGGTLTGFPYVKIESIPSPLEKLEEVGWLEKEKIETIKFGCPVELPVGEIIDELKEKAINLLIKLKILISSHEELSQELNNMNKFVSECNNSNCKVDCKCVRNPCFGFCPPIPCVFPCFSPCLQCIAACKGEPCPYSKIEDTLDKIKEIEERIFSTLKYIEGLFPQVEILLKNEEDPRNLKNLKEVVKLCASPPLAKTGEEPVWVLTPCKDALGVIGPGGQYIDSCHPRNFFCCTFSPGAAFPGANEAPSSRYLIFKPATEKFKPLPEENGCPQGYECDPDVKTYHQYQDASPALKEFLACVRKELDNIQTEREIEEKIGRISSISDSKLSQGTCDWIMGPLKPGGCSHAYEIRYGYEKVSAHYGGLFCRAERRSYAVDFGDEENYEYIKRAVRACEPGAYILHEGDHIHVSISALYNCGAK